MGKAKDGEASIAEAGLTGDMVKGRGWQESTGNTAKSWDFYVRLPLGVAAALDADGVRVVGPRAEGRWLWKGTSRRLGF